MSGNFTLKKLYAHARQLLEPRFEAVQLFEYVTKTRVHELAQKGDSPAARELSDTLTEMCGQRRAGVPLQYLLGEWEFYGLPFKVGRGVLIPRADTETIVDAALELLGRIRNPEILDLCSGAGCIAIALGHVRPAARITAVEKSPHAAGYLRENIKLNNSQVQPVEADLNDYKHPRPLDLVVCNPPYIPSGEIKSLMPELRYEPRTALDGGADGLDFYKIISKSCRDPLKPGGWLCFEVGINQASQVQSILEESGYESVKTYNDLAGIARVVCARRVGSK